MQKHTVTADNLNDLMQFDHVIEVLPDGTVIDGHGEHGIYAPELETLETGDEPDPGEGWELLTGMSGQDRYDGPIFHDSEYIGGGLADYILRTPGVYVALIVSWHIERDNFDSDEEYAEALEIEPYEYQGWVIARQV